MKSVLFGSLIACFLFVSCKKSEDETAAPAAKKEDSFIVTVNAVVAKDDIFQIFYNEEDNENFDPNQAVTVSVKGSDAPQDIVFEVPSDYKPVILRFDIGANPELKQVAFKNLKVEYKGKSFTAQGSKIMDYFYPNTQVEFDIPTATAKMTAPAEGYDPILGSTQLLKDEIAKLYR